MSSMLKKGTWMYSVFHNRCPRCQEGRFFLYSNPYNLSKFDKMEKHCTVCGENYFPETGYYFGAMYVSYAINVALFVTMWIAGNILLADDASFWMRVFMILIPPILLIPFTFRLSRIIWINFFVHYQDKEVHRSNP